MNKAKALSDAVRAINNALTMIELASEEMGRDIGGREISLAKTNCQQARHWLLDASTMLMESELTDEEQEEQEATCQALHPGKSCEEWHKEMDAVIKQQGKDCN